MKKIIIALGLCINLSSHAEDLQVGWELWFPYQYRNSQQELIGLDLEIFKAIFAKLDYTMQYTELPWKRHLHYIKTGEMDVAMGASLSQERRSYALFSQPYRKEIVKLFVSKGNAEAIHLTTLSGLTNSKYVIGVESGYYYGDDYQKLIKTLEFRQHIIIATDLEENVSLLLAGHIDGFLVDPATIKAFANKYQMRGEFEQHGLNIYQADIHFMFSKVSVKPVMVKAIDQAISDLKHSGELDKIINKWSELN